MPLKRKHASVQVSKVQRQHPKFIWAKLRGTPVMWPVKFMNEDDDGIHVYVHSDNAILTVKRKDMLPFPGDIGEMRKNGLVKLKKRKDTLNAFIGDIDWCLTGGEIVENERDFAANSEEDSDFVPGTSNDVVSESVSSEQSLDEPVFNSRKCLNPMKQNIPQSMPDAVKDTTADELPSSDASEHAETSDESHASGPVPEEEGLENDSDVAVKDSVADTGFVPGTSDNVSDSDSVSSEQSLAEPVYSRRKYLNPMKQKIPQSMPDAVKDTTADELPSSDASEHAETSDESHAFCPVPEEEGLENDSDVAEKDLVADSEFVPGTSDNDSDSHSVSSEQSLDEPVFNSRKCLNPMKQNIPQSMPDAVKDTTADELPSSDASEHAETSDESHASCPVPEEEGLENDSDVAEKDLVADTGFVPGTSDNVSDSDSVSSEQSLAEPVYSRRKYLNPMKQNIPQSMPDAVKDTTADELPSSDASEHAETSDESHATRPVPEEEGLENDSDVAEKDSVADSEFVPGTSDNDSDSHSVSSEQSLDEPVFNSRKYLNPMKQNIPQSMPDAVKDTTADELPSSDASEHAETSDESHATRPVPEEERLYSSNCKIYIKKYTKINEKSQTGRKFDCVHACCFCKRLFTNIQVHLEHHSARSEIQEIKSLKRKVNCAPSAAEKKSVMKEIKRLQTILRNKGDHMHNQSVARKKDGELLIARRKQGNFNHKEYGCCPECLEWIRLKENYKKHRINCASKNKSSDSMAHVQQFIFEGKVCPEASKHLKEEVFPSMMTGQITETAISDVLIISLGEFHFMSNIANKVRRKNYCSYRIRLAARLLHLLRKDLNKPDLSFLQALVVENFDAFVKCSMEACGLNEDEELKHPSTALKLGYDIARLTAAKGTYAIKRRDEQQRKDAADFAFLVQNEWKIKVRKRAVTLLEERQFNKPIQLPAPQDIATLAKYLVTSLREVVLDVDPIIFNRVAVLTEARLLLYNRRRPGELEAFDISTYKKRATEVDETDLSLRSELSKLEKMLLDSQELVEIRGKCNNRVPIILPAEVKEPLKYLADPEVRKKCGIKKNNPYMFANTGDLAIRAGEALNIVKYEVDLKLPQRILATNLRKHTATISQVMGLEDHQLRWLVNHMGHSEKVHLQNYRSTSGLIERLDIAKIMLMQEKNVVGTLAGVRLDDIRFEDLDDEQSDQGDGGVASLEAEVAEPDTAHANSTVSETRDSSDSDDVLSPLARTKKKKPTRVLRVPWTKNEIKEVEMYFKDYLDLKSTRKCPGMKDCMYAIHQSKVKGGLLCKRSWETLKKKVSHMMTMKRREILP